MTRRGNKSTKTDTRNGELSTDNNREFLRRAQVHGGAADQQAEKPALCQGLRSLRGQSESFSGSEAESHCVLQSQDCPLSKVALRMSDLAAMVGKIREKGLECVCVL